MPKATSDRRTTPRQLRELYIKGTLKQRYKIACQRIDHPDLGPSVLVNAVSALEGFSRAVAIDALVRAGNPLVDAYNFLRDTGTVDLISKHICPAFQTTPLRIFGAVAWKQIPEAVEWRNLLIHEATYLEGGICNSLIKACRHCLDKLADLASAR